jgi:hypothetical protein
MPHLKEPGDPALEFLHVEPVVRQPTTLEDIFQTIEEAPSIGDIGPSDVERLPESRRRPP